MSVWDRFHSKYLIVESGCWLWTGHLDARGRGNLNVDGKRIIASRLSYELHFDKIPDGLIVCHECDNPTCVNPDHLWLGTHAQNMADMVAKGRAKGPLHLQGSARHNAKLNEREVTDIRRRLANGEPVSGLAREIGVSISTISKIGSNKQWRHVCAPRTPSERTD